MTGTGSDGLHAASCSMRPFFSPSRFHLTTPTSPEAKTRSQPLLRPNTKMHATELDTTEPPLFTDPHLSKGHNIKYDLCGGAYHRQERLGGES